MSPQPRASLWFLSEQAPQQPQWVLGGSGTQAGEGRMQQLTCEAGCEKVTTGHMFDGHSRLALQKAGHKLRLELLGGSWERRTPSSTHGGSLMERSHGRAGLENTDEPLPIIGLSALPTLWLGLQSRRRQCQGL